MCSYTTIVPKKALFKEDLLKYIGKRHILNILYLVKIFSKNILFQKEPHCPPEAPGAL